MEDCPDFIVSMLLGELIAAINNGEMLNVVASLQHFKDHANRTLNPQA